MTDLYWISEFQICQARPLSKRLYISHCLIDLLLCIDVLLSHLVAYTLELIVDRCVRQKFLRSLLKKVDMIMNGAGNISSQLYLTRFKITVCLTSAALLVVQTYSFALKTIILNRIAYSDALRFRTNMAPTAVVRIF